MRRVLWSAGAVGAVAIVAVAIGLTAESLSVGTPASLGFSAERLGRLDTAMDKAVADNEVAGVVTLVLRHGKVAQFKAYGMADRENNVPMKTDTIFRLASASKVFTSVATLQLMEEGKLLITDPVSKYIPSFKNMTVAVPAPSNAPPGAPAFTLVPAKGPITIHHVITKTPGIAYASGPTQSLYEEAGFHDWYFAGSPEPMCTMMEKLGHLPAHAQPGERWMNGYTADILGCVVEKVSGMNLRDYMQKNIFDPLNMPDTYFFVPTAKASRVAVVYRSDGQGHLTRAEGPYTEGQGEYIEGQGPGVAFGGGAGLTTTAMDFGRFLEALLNGGELDGVRILGRKSAEMIGQNHVGDIYRNGTMGFGYQVDVNIEPGNLDRLGSKGDWGWQGAYFPRYRVDPVEDTVMIFMAQLTGYGGQSGLHDRFLNLVYQSLVDEPPAGMRSSLSESAAR